MKKTIKRIIIILVILGGVFYLGCSVKNKLAFYPDTVYIVEPSALPDYVSKKVVLTSDEKLLDALYFNHNDSLMHDLIIYFHGNAGNLYHRIGYADKLYQMGYNVLLMSYRGYAHSSGKPSEKGVYKDGEAALSFAQDSLQYTINNTHLFGRSLGTTIATHIAQDREFKSVILVTPLTCGKDMAKQFGAGAVKFLAGKSFNSIGKINHLKSPVLVIHGDKDEVISHTQGKEIYDTYKGVKQMITIEGGKHNDLQEVSPEKFWGGIEEFLKAK